jgi:Protein of unknown function (DUF3617)
MRKGSFLATSALALLVDCAPAADDPANIPKRGQWKISRGIISVKANGLSLDRKDLPFALPAISEEDFCTEPELRTNQWFEDKIRDTTNGRCTVTTLSRNGPMISRRGVCQNKNEGKMDVHGSFTVEGQESETSLRMNLNLGIGVTSRTGETDRVTMEARVAGERTGECSV